MRVAIVGAGGVGGYFGGRLAAAGVDTLFVVRGRTLDALARGDLQVDSILGDFRVKVAATDDPASAGKADVVLMAVKAWQLPEAAQAMKSLLNASTAVVPLENGIDAPEILASIVGREHVLGGLCAIVSYVVEPGHVRHAASEPIVMFGELDNSRSERVVALKDAFVRAGVNADVPPDIHRSMWTKFLFIAPLSGLGAITRVPVGEWRSQPGTRALAEAMLREIESLAKARGIRLDEDAIALTLKRYDALDPAATSSLQRDVMEGKPSELDAQLGAVVRLARESGVAAPVTEFVYGCLLPLERRARAS